MRMDSESDSWGWIYMHLPKTLDSVLQFTELEVVLSAHLPS